MRGVFENHQKKKVPKKKQLKSKKKLVGKETQR